ncbi:condensation domain-containing protein [Streptomyces sp. NPDC091972]|uniref:condensation domain-containing protein n=1 Tax=Streptomyces sp. NPDC091972 TaxID=3366007 RepID=UPI0037F1915E
MPGLNSAAPGPQTAEAVPFTYEQEWYDANVRQTYVHRNVRLSYEILGPLDRDLFEQAVHRFVARHDALRMEVLPLNERTPMAAQRVRPLGPDERVVHHQEVKAVSAEQFGVYAAAVLTRDFLEPWTTGHRPYTLRLLRYSSEHHAFLATFQNLVFDGRAHHLFAQEIWRDYEALRRRQEVPGTAPSFAAAALRQRTAFGPRHLRRAQDSWYDRAGFAGLNPWHRPDHAAASEDGAVPAELGAAQVAALRQACEREHCILLQWVVAAFARAIAQCTGRRRLSLWTSMDSRRAAERDVVGMFAGVAPLKVEHATAPLPEVRAEVSGQILEALRYQQLSGRQLRTMLRELAPDEGWLGRDIHINLRRFEGDHQQTRHDGDLRVTADAYPLRRVTFANASALQLRCDEYRDRLFINLLFDGHRVGRQLAQAILGCLTADLTVDCGTDVRTPRKSS